MGLPSGGTQAEKHLQLLCPTAEGHNGTPRCGLGHHLPAETCSSFPILPSWGPEGSWAPTGLVHPGAGAGAEPHRSWHQCGGSKVPLHPRGHVPLGAMCLCWSTSVKCGYLYRLFPSVIIRHSNYPLMLVIWKQHEGTISSCDREYGNVCFSSSVLHLSACPQLWKHRCSCSLARE